MRVIRWGTYDTGKPRARILSQGIVAAGMELIEVHSPVWEGIEDKSQVKTWPGKFAIALRWLFAYPGLIWRLLRSPRVDLILIGYPGVIDVLIAKLVARWKKVPVAWDVFISLYDTICLDRKLLPEKSLAARCLFRLEQFALRRADIPFMDTRTHSARIERVFGLNPDHCGWVWVGVETNAFAPSPRPAESTSSVTRVLFYGQFIPLHGISVLIEAARLLEAAPIAWTMIGTGQEARHIQQMLDEHPLPKLQWLPWVEYQRLQHMLHQSHVSLGIFGDSEKAASVIPNKVFQIVAADRPLITRDSAAIRELLDPDPPCVYLVPPMQPQALANAVWSHHLARLQAPPVAPIHSGKSSVIDPPAIGRQFADMILRRCTNND